MIYDVQVLFIISFIIGLIGLFFGKIATWVTWFWYKLAEVLGLFVPKILLSLTFYVFLLPLALLSRLFKKDLLRLNKDESTYWEERKHKYVAKDLDQIW